MTDGSVRDALCKRWQKHHTRDAGSELSESPVQCRRLGVEILFESQTPATINDIRKVVLSGWRGDEGTKEEWRLIWDLPPMNAIQAGGHNAATDPARGLPRLVVLLALKAYVDVLKDTQDKYTGILLEAEYRRFRQNYGIKTNNNFHDSFRQIWGDAERKQEKITLYVCCLGGTFTRNPPFHRAWILNLNPGTDIQFSHVDHTGEQRTLSAEEAAATARRIWGSILEESEFLLPMREVILESLCAGRKPVEGRNGRSALDGPAGALLKPICDNPITDGRITSLGRFVEPPFDFGEICPDDNSFEGLMHWIRAQDMPRLAVIGPPKVGKTVILAQIAREMSRQENPGDLVPVLAAHDEWRYWRSFDDVVRYVTHWNRPQGMPVGRARALLAQARADILFLLDGAELDYEGQLGKLLSRRDLLGESAAAVTGTAQSWRCSGLPADIVVLRLPCLAPDRMRRFAASLGLPETGWVQHLLQAKPDWFRTPARLKKLKELYDGAPNEDHPEEEWQSIGEMVGAVKRRFCITRCIRPPGHPQSDVPADEGKVEAALQCGNRLLITGRSPDTVQRLYLHILQQRTLAADLDIRLDVEFTDEDVDGILDANINSKILLSCSWIDDIERTHLLRRAVEGLLAQGHEVEVLIACPEPLWEEGVKEDPVFWGTFIRHETNAAPEKDRTAGVVAMLRAMRQALPGLARKLARSDSVCLCRRLQELCRQVVEDIDSDTILAAMDEFLDRLKSKVPVFDVSVRGAESPTSTTPVPDEAVKALASRLGEEAERQLTLLQPELERENRQHGDPERWFFERLTPPLRERAARVRDYCEERLEILHAQAMSRCGISSGIGHSKRVLRLSADLLHAFEGSFSDAFPYYTIYVAAYCHDLGMMLRQGEDAGDAGVLSKIRETHGSRTSETIVGDRALGIPSAWRAMGFGSEQEAAVIARVCSVHQQTQDEDLRRMPVSQPLFLDGQSSMVSPLALAAILRIANALDCHPNRLPPVDCLASRSIGPAELLDYLKHEIVEDVSIDSKGRIQVQLRVRYIYPPEWRVVEKVHAALETEILCVAKTLNSCGLRLPPPQFTHSEALFLEAHPYLGADDTTSGET